MPARNKPPEPRRIAIFQYEWPLQTHTLNLARKLAEHGYHVDLLLKDCRADLVDLGSLAGKRITVRDVSAPVSRRTRLLRKLVEWMRARGEPTNRLLDGAIRLARYARQQARGVAATAPVLEPAAVEQALLHLGSNRYCWFIGVEKHGLIWAGRLAETMAVPYLYYSLELYLDDQPGRAGDPRFLRLRSEEVKYHQRSAATIIQDRSRASVLLGANRVESTDVLYLPVSLPEEESRATSSWVHDQVGIARDKKLLVYFGMICAERRCHEIAAVAGDLGEKWRMVFHGYGPPKDIRELQDPIKYNNLALSLKSVPSSSIKTVIASATIGLVLYGGGYVNDRLTAFSSEKIALYLQSGIPIIAFDIGNFRELTDKHRCGELIASPTELPAAAEKILADYERYREAAFEAFRALYRYDNYLPAIVEYLARGGDVVAEHREAALAIVSKP